MARVASGLVGLGLIVAHLPAHYRRWTRRAAFRRRLRAGYRVARTHRDVLSSVQLALEQVLDRLEHGEFERPPGLLGAISSRARLPR